MSKLVGKKRYNCPHCNQVTDAIVFQYKPINEFNNGYHYTDAILLGCRNCYKVFWYYSGYKIS